MLRVLGVGVNIRRCSGWLVDRVALEDMVLGFVALPRGCARVRSIPVVLLFWSSGAAAAAGRWSPWPLPQTFGSRAGRSVKQGSHALLSVRERVIVPLKVLVTFPRAPVVPSEKFCPLKRLNSVTGVSKQSRTRVSSVTQSHEIKLYGIWVHGFNLCVFLCDCQCKHGSPHAFLHVW